LKIFCALVFVLSSFAAANAQTLDASTIVAYYLDDCLEVITEQSSEPAQIVPAEPTTEGLSETLGVASSAADIGEDASAGAMQPGNEARSEPPADNTVEQSTTGASVIATEPTAEELDESPGVAATATDVAEDASVGAIQPGNEAQSEPPMDDTVELSTTPASIIATEPTTGKSGDSESVAIAPAPEAQDAPVAAPADQAPVTEHSSRDDDGPALDETIARSTEPAVIVATASPLETPGEVDSVAATPADDAEDSSAEAMEPSAEVHSMDEAIALLDDRSVFSSD
jgi:hypothetical protein